jgi:HD-GYP domain-containing protein (c-di-GMP phosphodiesterase class II)
MTRKPTHEELKHRIAVLEAESIKLQQEQEALDREFRQLRIVLGATVQTIAVAVEAKDPYTIGHQRRVSDLTRAIAIEMNLSSDKIHGIRTAAAVHDLGKMLIPAEILNKPVDLADIEFGLIKTHPQAGYEILKDIEYPWPIARIVLEHHERMNGSGYPNGLKGEQTLLESRILSVADVVEAMASRRSYRSGLKIESALQELEKHRGTLYDVNVVDACLILFRARGFQIPSNTSNTVSDDLMCGI